VEGFPDQSFQLASGFISVVLATFLRGAPSWGTLSSFGLVFKEHPFIGYVCCYVEFIYINV
jgi:hypothetical protein